VTPSDPTRQSIEVEYWVIDSEGRLTAPGDLVEASPGAEREFVAPLLEVKTTPCETTTELREELFGRLRDVLERAAELDLGLVPLATPVHDGEIRELPSTRTQVQNRAVGDNFAYVRHCAGTHIHVEQVPGHEIDQLNALTALDPALALVNSSPYFGREPMAAGARSKLYRRLAYADLPRQGRLWPYAESATEWSERLERRYEAFLRRAIAAGVERATVESAFDPESAVWVPVKLRETFGTVEWRSPDTALPSQVLQLAEDIVGVLGRVSDTTLRRGERGRVTDEEIVLPPFEAVRNHVDAAVRDGLTPDVQSYLDRMGFDVERYDPLSSEVAQGTVSPAEARRLRREYADRLERDVRQASAISAD
jgi:carboxylate-amine ligase